MIQTRVVVPKSSNTCTVMSRLSFFFFRTSMPLILQSGTVRKPINKPLIWSDIDGLLYIKITCIFFIKTIWII